MCFVNGLLIYQVYLSGKPLVFGDPNSEFGQSILILPSFF